MNTWRPTAKSQERSDEVNEDPILETPGHFGDAICTMWCPSDLPAGKWQPIIIWIDGAKAARDEDKSECHQEDEAAEAKRHPDVKVCLPFTAACSSTCVITVSDSETGLRQYTHSSYVSPAKIWSSACARMTGMLR